MSKESTAVGGGSPDREMASGEAAPAAPGRLCPHCASVNVQRWGTAGGLPRYRCGGCRRTFNPLTGTSLARLRNLSQRQTITSKTDKSVIHRLIARLRSL